MTATLSYKPKSKVLFHDRVWTIVRTVTASSVLIEDRATGEIREVNVADLRPPAPKEVEAVRRASPRPRDEASLAEARRRLAIIKPLLDQPAATAESVDAAVKASGVCRATLFNWLTAYRDGGQLSCLAPVRRGRAMPARLDERVEAIIRGVIDDYYLQGN